MNGLGLTKNAVLALAVLGLLLLTVPGFAGVPEPGIVLYGKVTSTQGGAPITQGTLQWTLTPVSGGTGVTVTTPLQSITVPDGTLNYVVTIPVETGITEDPLSAGVLPLPPSGTSVDYTATPQIVGATASSSYTIPLAGRGQVLRQDIQSSVPPPTQKYHSGDTNKDYKFSLSELMREIQLYELCGTAHDYHCDATTEDGYAPGVGDQSCGPYSGDYYPSGTDWKIDLHELLRMIDLFASSYASGHEYVVDATTEDGFRAITTAAKSLEAAGGVNVLAGNPLVSMRRNVVLGAEKGPVIEVTLNYRFAGAGPITALGIQENLPEGWSFQGIVSGDGPNIVPTIGTEDLLEFAWFPVPSRDGGFTYRVAMRQGESKSLSQQAIYGEGLYRFQDLAGELAVPILEGTVVDLGLDSDGDGVPDAVEQLYGTDPNNPNDFPQMPLCSWPMLFLIPIVGGLALMRRHGKCAGKAV